MYCLCVLYERMSGEDCDLRNISGSEYLYMCNDLQADVSGAGNVSKSKSAGEFYLLRLFNAASISGIFFDSE